MREFFKEFKDFFKGLYKILIQTPPTPGTIITNVIVMHIVAFIVIAVLRSFGFWE